MSTGPSKSRSHRENITYPRLEKPRFLFFKGSAGTTATPVVAAAALVSARRRCRSTRHPLRRARAPAPLIARRRVPPYPPRAPVPLPPLRPLATGVGNSTSRWGGARPLSLSSSSSSDEFSGIAGGSPCCSRSPYSSLSCSQRSRRWILLFFPRAARSCSRRYAARAAARARGVGGSDHAASTITLC
jgi:hypothetical protein